MIALINDAYTNYGLFITSINGENAEQDAVYSVYSAVNPSAVPSGATTEDDLIANGYGKVKEGVSFNGDTSFTILDDKSGASFNAENNTYVVLIAKIQDDSLSVEESDSKTFSEPSAESYPSFSTAFDKKAGITYQIQNIPEASDPVSFGFQIYLVGASSNPFDGAVNGATLYTDSGSGDALSFGDGLTLSLQKTITNADIDSETHSVSGSLDSAYNAGQTYYVLATVSLLSDGSAITPERILGTGTASVSSVLLLDTGMDASDFLVIDQSPLIATSQNSGTELTLPSVSFGSSDDETFYLSNIVIQAKNDIEGSGMSDFQNALEAAGITDYAIVAKAKIDETNLHADYASYYASVAGSLHLHFKDVVLPKVTGLSFNDMSIEYGDEFGSDFNVGDFVRNTIESNNVLDEVTLLYSTDGTTYSETFPTLNTVGRCVLHIKAEREGYQTSNSKQVVFEVLPRTLYLKNDATFEAVGIEQYAILPDGAEYGIIDVGVVDSNKFKGIYGEDIPTITAVATYPATFDRSTIGATCSATFTFALEGENASKYKIADDTEYAGTGIVVAFHRDLTLNADAFVVAGKEYGDALDAAIEVTVDPEKITGLDSRFTGIQFAVTGAYTTTSETGDQSVGITSCIISGGNDSGKYTIVSFPETITGEVSKRVLGLGGCTVPSIEQYTDNVSVALSGITITNAATEADKEAIEGGLTGTGSYASSDDSGSDIPVTVLLNFGQDTNWNEHYRFASNMTTVGTVTSVVPTLALEGLEDALGSISYGDDTAAVFDMSRITINGTISKFSDVGVQLVGAYESSDEVGDNITVTITGCTLTGNDAARYNPPAVPITLSGTVTRKQLSVDNLSGYQSVNAGSATNEFPVTIGQTIGIKDGDNISIVGTAIYDDVTDIGPGERTVNVTLHFELEGDDDLKAKYIVPADQETTGTVVGNKYTISIPSNALTADSIQYRSSSLTTNITINETLVTVNGVTWAQFKSTNSYDITLSATGTYADANSTGEKSVEVTFALTGNDADKCHEPSEQAITGTVTPASLTIDPSSIVWGDRGDRSIPANSAQTQWTFTANAAGIYNDEVSVIGTATYASTANNTENQRSVQVPVNFSLTSNVQGDNSVVNNYNLPASITVTGYIRGKEAVPTIWYTGVLPQVYACLINDEDANYHAPEYDRSVSDLITANQTNAANNTLQSDELQQLIAGLDGLYAFNNNVEITSGTELTYNVSQSDWETAVATTSADEEAFPEYSGYYFFLTNQNISNPYVVNSGNMRLTNYDGHTIVVEIDGVRYTGLMSIVPGGASQANGGNKVIFS